MFALKDAASSDFNWGYVGAAISFSSFVWNTSYLLPRLAPVSIQKTSQKCWKWRNTVNSLIHSSITGIGAIANLWATPELGKNLISIYTASSVAVNATTVGYFLYDFVDLFRNNLKKSYGLILHHAMVITCFGLSLVTRKYQGYAMVSLILEINSIFLHIRQLLILHGVEKSNFYYKVCSYATVGTFLVFRLIPLIWQMNWLADHKKEVPNEVVILGFAAGALILVLNLGLLFQILKKDFILKSFQRKL